ncbi:hypothetical protein O7543_13795 [Solwaraspora sp. WMMA2080]|uniref:hypothetical protein n=1 Tax=Solwaraspora sp. WMMA2080 TaxID=3015165 RepID=UPI00248AB5AC|nr:hypothetical protein [Solwaraspora sp. WMMA2080]WBC23400.1 hypothetical protein O7543_13795 [Solwaraspora sp. WMMA2080]
MTYNVKNVEVPELPPGTVLRFAVSEWQYGRGPVPGEPFDLLITYVRIGSARSYGGQWVWVDGHHVDCRPDHPPCQQALVSVAAVRRAAVGEHASIQPPPAEQVVVDGAAARR